MPEPDKVAALQRTGYKVEPCKKFAGSVINGINRVRDYEICIVAGSKNLFKEIQNYQKKQDANGVWHEEPASNQVDHLADSLRYGLETQKTGTIKKVKFRV